MLYVAPWSVEEASALGASYFPFRPQLSQLLPLRFLLFPDAMRPRLVTVNFGHAFSDLWTAIWFA
jgi:hypothetical protein